MNKMELKNAVINAGNGDKKAVEKLYREYHDKLYFFVLKKVGNKDAAEDITEETFLSSMQSIASLKNADRYETWLHSIAYNKCKMYFRQENRNEHISLDDEANGFQYHADETIMLPEDYTANKELKRHLKKVINNLKPDMISVVILYYYDGMSIKNISGIMNISETAIKQKLHKARLKIKKEIEKMFDDALLSAVPINAMMRNTISPKYVAVAKSGRSVSMSSSALALKVAGIAAAGTVAIGVPLALSNAKDSNFGIFYNDESDQMIKSIDFEEDKSNSEISDSFDNTYEKTNLNDHADETSWSDDSEKSESHFEVDSYMKPQNTTSMTNKISETDETGSMNNDSSAENKTNLLNAEQLLNMTLNEALSLGNDQYDMVYPTCVQQGNRDMYRCSDFPEYCFRSNNSDNKIDTLNLYNGARITNDIYVGMTYNELSDALGEELAVSLSNTDFEFSASAVINGRLWVFSFDFIDEQKEELIGRIKSQAEDPEAFELHPYAYSVTIPDMNPNTYSAVYYVDFQI